MIFKPAFLIHYISQFMQLEAGDIITTGTPAGVGLGFNPPKYLKAGDGLRYGHRACILTLACNYTGDWETTSCHICQLNCLMDYHHSESCKLVPEFLSPIMDAAKVPDFSRPLGEGRSIILVSYLS